MFVDGSGDCGKFFQCSGSHNSFDCYWRGSGSTVSVSVKYC